MVPVPIRWCVASIALVLNASAFANDEGQREAASGTIGVEPLSFKFEPVSLGALQEPESQPATAPDLDKKHDWRAAVTIWMWFPGIDGTMGAKNLTVDVNATFVDILNDTDSVLGAGGRFEAGMGKWGGYVDGQWMKLAVDNVNGPANLINVDVVNEIGILDFGLMYRVGDWPDQGPDQPHTTLDAYVGGRWWSTSLKLDPANAPSREKSLDWVDPLIGAKLYVPIGEHLALSIWGDVGGFGVSSDFTWSATGIFGYRFELFHIPSAAYFGYRAIGDDFTNDSGARKFTWDIILHGPILGFTMNF